MEMRRRIAGGAPEPGIQGLALFLPEIRMALQAKDYNGLKLVLREIHPVDLADGWGELTEAEQLLLFRLLDWTRAVEVFEELSPPHQQHLMANLDDRALGEMLADLSPDDRARLFHSVSERIRRKLTSVLKHDEAQKVREHPVFPEGTAGALMSTGAIALRKNQTIRQALGTVQATARVRMTDDLNYFYVVDEHEHLIGSIGLRSLITAPPDITVGEMMSPVSLIRVRATMDQEEVARLFGRYDLISAPVVDDENRLLGVVTANDIVGGIRDEATEDMQKIGGMEVLDAPYLTIDFVKMIKRRAGWLSALFLGEMLTATAMGYFEAEIARAVVLALFVPLIISSGGNSGSQATTLVIRAMALRELNLSDWWRVIRREIAAGLALGSVLATIGLLRILLWQGIWHTYGAHYLLIGLTVAGSLIGVVTFGTFVGSLLPFVLRRLGFDPASASAPFVATLVDVTGLIIYFSIASVVLRGTLL